MTSDEITNETIVATVDNMRHLYFVRGEWPKNNITYYVIGGGVKTAIQQDNVAATNGIIHYIDRVLGVPYQSLWEIIKNETRLQLFFIIKLTIILDIHLICYKIFKYVIA